MQTFKASKDGVAKIKQAREDKKWTVDSPKWLEHASKIVDPSCNVLAEGISEGTWKRFLSGKNPINANAFRAYCQVLGLTALCEQTRHNTQLSLIGSKNKPQ